MASLSIPGRWRFGEGGAVLWAGRDLASIRRHLAVCLGLIWLMDAALQFQPYMFGPFFVTQTIQPAAAGNPEIVANSITWASHLMLQHQPLSNALFAGIQLVLAVGILIPRTCKPTIAASMAWALSVWWFGEGLGGILTGASPLAGEPGGVLLYALIAVLIWPADGSARSQQSSVAASGPLGNTGTRVVWLTVWLSFSFYLLLPANRAPDAVAQILSVTDSQPGWVTALMDREATLADGRGTAISIAIALLCAATAVGVWYPRLIRPALVIAV
ncbi:MAG: hypothetical protein J2P17_36475, partial [Mycobacterium sp.]|nr:hypothetical protein [Mycobacterium sp.]